MGETAKAGDHGIVALRPIQMLGVAQRAHEGDTPLLVGEVLAMLKGQVEEDSAVGRQREVVTGANCSGRHSAGGRVTGIGAGSAAPEVAGKLVEQQAQGQRARRGASPWREASRARHFDLGTEARGDFDVERQVGLEPATLVARGEPEGQDILGSGTLSSPRAAAAAMRSVRVVTREHRMIPRYSRPEMAAIFSPETRLGIWLEVELVAAEAMAAIGAVPAEAVRTLAASITANRERLIDPHRIEEIEARTRHDVIAFLTRVEEVCGAEARYLHLGLTSSDLLDTTLAIQLERAADLILVQIDAVLEALERRAFEHKRTPTIGRSHGIHAEPTSFGLKLAGHFAEFSRGRRRMVQARYEIMTCAISGAVGTFANVDPRVEQMVAERFGLRPEPVSTQVIPRDRHAAFVTALSLLAAAIERLATEVRHLQRTEVGEAEEPFAEGQKGSSAMPHKRNPVLSENLTGIARMIRATVVPALENVALWHERDISHSSVERVMLPDACILADFALHRLAGLVEGLVIYPERMKRNLDASQGLYSSQRVMLALTEAGLPRQRAYEIVQRHAMVAWREGRPLLELLRAEPEVTERLDEARLAALFDLDHHLAQTDHVFERVFGGATHRG